MKISRTLFLALTGAIAGASACHVYVDDPAARMPPPPPPEPPAPTAYAYPAPYATTYSTTMTPTASHPYGVRQLSPKIPVIRRRQRAVGLATNDPGYRPPPPSFRSMTPATEGLPPSPTESGATIAPAVTAMPAPTTLPPSPAVEGCLDTESMAVPDCSGVRVAASCSTRSFILQRCEAYRAYMDSKVATVAIQCMEGLRNTCDPAGAYDCGKQALSESCSDNGLSQMCAIAASSCRTTPGDCAALLSGLNDAGKQEVARCIGRGCQAGLYSCVEGLSKP